MPASLVVHDDGLAKVRRKVNAMKKRSQDATPAWKRIGSFMSSEVRKQFVTEGAYFETPWEPLKPKYKAWKLSHGGINKILRFSGEMMKTFTDRPMQIEQYFPDHAVYGSADPKALWHDGGTRRNDKQVNPARPIFFKTPAIQQGVRDRLAEYIVGKKTYSGGA